MQYRFPVEVRPGEKLNSYHFAPTVWKIKEISYIAKSIVYWNEHSKNSFSISFNNNNNKKESKEKKNE